MAQLKIYGIAQSRTFRTLWLAIELGLDYEQVELGFNEDGVRGPGFLAINPNGKVPTIKDGNFVLWESMAINLYLAQKPGPMHAASAAVTGLAAQWSFWAMLETEALLLDLLSHRVLLVEHVRDPSHVERNTLLLQKPLGILNQALSGREHLAGDSFTVADLNVASILAWGKLSRLDFSPHPSVARWLERVLERPAYKRMWDLRTKVSGGM
jgi:glutathione S-transferase